MLLKGLLERFTAPTTNTSSSELSTIQQAKKICVEQLLVPFESYAKKLPNGDCQSYPDPATGGDPWTIGYGSTYHADGKLVVPGEVWTREYSMLVKQKVLDKFVVGVLRLCPDLINEHPNKLAAVASFAYNVGLQNLEISNLRKKINAKSWLECPKEFAKWTKANGRVMKGLVRRRKAEADVFMTE